LRLPDRVEKGGTSTKRDLSKGGTSKAEQKNEKIQVMTRGGENNHVGSPRPGKKWARNLLSRRFVEKKQTRKPGGKKKKKKGEKTGKKMPRKQRDRVSQTKNLIPHSEQECSPEALRGGKKKSWGNGGAGWQKRKI